MENTLIKKYILAGGPGGMKTEILDVLRNEKFFTVENAASHLIKDELSKKIPESKKLLPWTNPGLYQEKVLKDYIEWTTKDISKSIKKMFIEGWFVEQQAHWEFNNMEVPQKLLDEITREKGDFEKVFLIELMPDYKQTETRKYTYEQASNIHSRIKELYHIYGFKLVDVMPDKIDSRVDFILKEAGCERKE